MYEFKVAVGTWNTKKCKNYPTSVILLFVHLVKISDYYSRKIDDFCSNFIKKIHRLTCEFFTERSIIYQYNKKRWHLNGQHWSGVCYLRLEFWYFLLGGGGFFATEDGGNRMFNLEIVLSWGGGEEWGYWMISTRKETELLFLRFIDRLKISRTKVIEIQEKNKYTL